MTNKELISFSEAKALSEKLYPLGDQCPEIWEDLFQSGYGEPIRIFYDTLRLFAESDQNYQRLIHYWTEYAKERLAALKGPLNILNGDIPDISAYRSEFLHKLRTQAHSPIPEKNLILSPQIEPTLKRFLELMPDDPIRVKAMAEYKNARSRAAKLMGFEELSEFAPMNSDEKYNLLSQRYTLNLESAGFSVDSNKKHSLIFRKKTSNAKWDFIFIDLSKGGMDAGYIDTPMVVLTLPNKVIFANSISKNAVATFAVRDLVPGFDVACRFSTDSYAELSLAADTIAFIINAIYSRVDEILLR